MKSPLTHLTSWPAARLAVAILTLTDLQSLAGTYKHITIDGSFADWAGVPVAYSDPSDTTDASDYKDVYVANDDDYLYVRFTLYTADDPFTSRNNLFIDADANVDTGYRVLLGSEMLIQGGSGYQEKNGGFNEGGIVGLDWLRAPTGANSTDFEFRVSRHAKFDSDQTDVFASADIALLLESETSSFTRVETAPDTEGLPYTFAVKPPVLPGPLPLVSLTGKEWQINDAGTDLGTGWLASDYDDTQSGWRAGKGLFGFTSDAGVYPAAILTATPAESKTVYLRAKFPYLNDQSGAVLVLSNYLSDGAVFYLNGTEVKRVRMPSGPITAATAASGENPAKGQAELIGIDPNVLVVGDNILAVELHQAPGGAADLVFGMSFLATPTFAPAFPDPLLPADREVVAGTSTTFAAEILGSAPLTYQWLKDGNPVAGATSATHTINPVLPGDDGSYSLRVSNSVGTNTTRAAKLTILGTPIVITDATRPLDTTVTEGTPASFTVVNTGSAPVTYVWTKDGIPVLGATGATLDIPDVRAIDAGLYRVTVSNPVNSLQSREARLTVTADTVAPTLTAIIGSPNSIHLTFSEPLDLATATNTANFSAAGLTIQSVILDTNDSRLVTLQTSAQTLGSSYSVTVSNLKDRFNNAVAAGTSRSFLSTINIDGSFTDWAGVAIGYTDPSEPPAAGTDFKDVYAASDADFLYLRFTLYSPGNPNTFLNNIFIDTDNDPLTGYRVAGIGSEILIQEGAGYQQKNGGFNEGAVTGLDFLVSPSGEGSDFELRISRKALFDGDKLPVFASQTIRVVLETENSSFATTDTAPDTEGFEITLTDGPTPMPTLVILKTAEGVRLTWEGTAKLQYRAALDSGSWTEVSGAASPVNLDPTTGPGFYRLIAQ